jgi:hypothetical protein
MGVATAILMNERRLCTVGFDMVDMVG